MNSSSEYCSEASNQVISRVKAELSSGLRMSDESIREFYPKHINRLFIPWNNSLYFWFIFWEYLICCGVVQTLGQNLGEDIAIIGRDRQIAWSNQLTCSHPGPFAMNFATIHVSTQHHHHAAMTMICAQAAIFRSAPPKLGHGHSSQPIHVI